MENLNKGQKAILISICILMFLVICYYFMQKTKQYDNLEVDSMTQNNEKEINHMQDEAGIIVVHITGAVLEEGIVHIEEGSRIVDVIAYAGGISNIADLSRVNLAYKVSDGQKIYIPSIYDENNEQEVVSNNSGDSVIVDGDILQSGGLVNINRASQTELETLNGIRTIYCFENN